MTITCLFDHSHMIGSTFPRHPPPPIGPTASEILEELIPSSTNLETYNAEYLQRSGGSAAVFLAAAKASHILGAPADEVSSTVFNILNPDVDLSIEVGYHATQCESHAEPTLGFHRSSFLSKRDKLSPGRRAPVTTGFEVRVVNNIQAFVRVRDTSQASNWELDRYG